MHLKLSARKAFQPFQPDIDYYSRLRDITPKDATAFVVRFHHRHAYSLTSGRYSSNSQTSPLKYEWALSKWSERKEPFWWSCVAARKELAVAKKLTRSWMAKRVRCAVVESLQKKGFKPDGTSLDGTQKEIYGTAQFLPGPLALKLPYADIVKQTDTAIEKIIKVESKSQDNRSAPWKPRSDGGKRETRFDQRSKGKLAEFPRNRNHQGHREVQKSRGGIDQKAGA